MAQKETEEKDSSNPFDGSISKANIGRLGEDKELFIDKVLKDLAMSEKQLNPWKTRLVKYMDLYKMVQTKKHYSGLASIFVPEILRAVETIVANIYKVLFNQDPFFEYRGRDVDFDDSANAMTELVKFQMDENRFKIKTLDSIRQMVVSGLTVRKVGWDFQQVRRKTKTLNFINEPDLVTGKNKRQKNISTEDKVETVRDVWTLEPVDLIGFHISDVGVPYHDIQKARWIMEQYLVQTPWLKEKIKKQWLADIDIKELDELAKPPTSEATTHKENLRRSSGFSSIPNFKGIEILERWGLLEAKYVYDSKKLEELELEPDDFVETVIVIANRKLVLKLEANPFWHDQKPYLSCPYLPIENEFAGMGVAQIAESLQEELNDTRNQVMDNKTLILMNMWLKSRGAGINNRDLRIRAQGVINTNDMNGLRPLAPPVLSGVGVNIEGVVKNDLRESVGAASNLQGIAQSGVSTATESTQINNASFGRIMLNSQMFAELIIKPLLVMVEFLNYQFYDNAKIVRVIGVDGIFYKRIAPNDIVGYKDVIIRLASDLDESPNVKRQQLLQFLTIVQGMPPPVISMHWKLLDRIYKAFFPSGHTLEDLYPVPPEHEKLIKPEDENELLFNGHPVKVHQGDDDEAHMRSHEEDYGRYKYAPQFSAELYQEHMLEHMASAKAKVAAQQAQMEAQMMAEQGGKNPNGSQPNPASAGQPINPGQTPGATAMTPTATPSDATLTRNVGGY